MGLCEERRKVVVYYESIKRELKIRRIYECRCDERLQTKLRNKAKEFTRLGLVYLQQPVVYYESRNRDLKIRLMNEGRCDERLKTRVEESTCLTYTGFHDKTN